MMPGGLHLFREYFQSVTIFLVKTYPQPYLYTIFFCHLLQTNPFQQTKQGDSMTKTTVAAIITPDEDRGDIIRLMKPERDQCNKFFLDLYWHGPVKHRKCGQ